ICGFSIPVGKDDLTGAQPCQCGAPENPVGGARPRRPARLSRCLGRPPRSPRCGGARPQLGLRRCHSSVVILAWLFASVSHRPAPIGALDVSSSAIEDRTLRIFANVFRGEGKPGLAGDAEVVAAAALLAAALVVGLATAADYGLTVDEVNTDDYGPKALAWYTSAFTDRSHFDTVEFSLWYYGPWFQMLTAYVQSFDLADRGTVRHAMTFLVGLSALAALLPIGRLAIGRWAGLTAIALCLLTGYLYGSL